MAAVKQLGATANTDIGDYAGYVEALEDRRQSSRCWKRYGTHPNLHLVLFTVDADVFSREIAPLAGFYPSVYVGAPWWFLDNPSEIRSFNDQSPKSQA